MSKSLAGVIFKCCHVTGFPRFLESLGLFFLKIPGPGKSRKITLVPWKVLEKYP